MPETCLVFVSVDLMNNIPLLPNLSFPLNSPLDLVCSLYVSQTDASQHC